MRDPLNKNLEMFRWGPVVMRYYYMGDFLYGIFSDTAGAYRNTYEKKYYWPNGLCLKNGPEICFVQEFPELRRAGKKVFLDLMFDKEKREKVWKGWLRDKERVENIEDAIDNSDLESLENEEFLKLWEDFTDAVIGFWNHVVVPELANYGSSEYLREQLDDYVPKAERDSVLETLTAPDRPSFYQDEEIDLAETEDTREHAKKYYWIRNRYNGVEVLDETFFIKRKIDIDENIHAEVDEYFNKLAKSKKNIQSKYNLPADIMKTAQAIVDGIVWQDRRKKDVLVYLHYKELLLAEVSRRYGYNVDSLRDLTSAEITELLKGNKELEMFGDRSGYFGYLCDGVVETVQPGIAEEYWDFYVSETVGEDVSEVGGIVASRGKVKGPVRVVRDAMRVDVFHDGDILVAPMTSPEFVFLMKKSGGIVTDTGGLTSHAAIVSRELKKPCIVGTKIATQVFKDGDMVEVDAERGVVTKLNASKD